MGIMGSRANVSENMCVDDEDISAPIEPNQKSCPAFQPPRLKHLFGAVKFIGVRTHFHSAHD